MAGVAARGNCRGFTQSSWIEDGFISVQSAEDEVDGLILVEINFEALVFCSNHTPSWGLHNECNELVISKEELKQLFPSCGAYIFS